MASTTGNYKMIDILNRYDDTAIETTSDFFKRHGLVQVAERIKFGYAADFGAMSTLRHVLIVMFGLDARKFVRFYERMWRSKEVPHYEDAWAVAALIVSVVALFLSPIIGVEYQILRTRVQKDKENFRAEDYRQILALFKYLALAYALREAYYLKKISRKKFSELRTVAEKEVLGSGIKLSTSLQSQEVKTIWDDFNKTANLPFDDRLTEELKTIALSQKDKQAAKPRKAKQFVRGNFVELNGLGTSAGRATGPIKVVHSADDIGMVNEGDIGVFMYFNPDMVPAIKKCVASIGLPKCGGRTGHLAIVSRQLGIPCVLKIESDSPFANGKLVEVNGTSGRVRVFV